MKIGKEGVIATIAALERWAELDHGAIHAERMARLERCKAKLDRLPGVTVTVELDSTSKLFSRLLLHVDPVRTGITAAELAQALWDETPSIAVRNLMADIGLLQIDLRRASEEVADQITATIVRIVESGKGRVGAADANRPAPNLADAGLAGALRFPLAMKGGDRVA